MPAIVHYSLNMKIKLWPTSLGLWGIEEEDPWYSPPFAWSYPRSGILLHMDNFPSYFLHCEPGPKGFVESKTHSLCHGRLSVVWRQQRRGMVGYFVIAYSSVCCALLSFLFLLPSYPFPVLSHCVQFPSSFLPSSSYAVYIVYQDLQTANLNGIANPFTREGQPAQKKP